MTMKKILAGVIASASVMAMSAPAFAATPTNPLKPTESGSKVTAPGETEYDAEVGMLTAALDVELPASMTAFINPYGAEVAVNEDATPANVKKMSTGVVSWAYEIVNNTKDYGIYIDAKNVKGTASTGVKFVSTAPAAGAKEVQMNLAFAKDAAAFSAFDGTKATAGTKQDLTGGFVQIGTTAVSQTKFGYAPAATGTTTVTPGKAIVGFVGAISKEGSKSADNKVTEWTEDDTLTVSYVLKISPAPTTAANTDLPTT